MYKSVKDIPSIEDVIGNTPQPTKRYRVVQRYVHGGQRTDWINAWNADDAAYRVQRRDTFTVSVTEES